MYCIRCGKKLCEDANYCHNCGAPVVKAQKAAPSTKLSQTIVPEEMKYIDNYVNSLFQEDENALTEKVKSKKNKKTDKTKNKKDR